MTEFKPGDRIKVRTRFLLRDVEHLTPGVVYEGYVVHERIGGVDDVGVGAVIANDLGSKSYITLTNCAHLEGRDWEVLGDG